MPPNESRALCVSIHDVAPATWPECILLWNAMREVLADMPLTWLVVPCFHGTVRADGEPDLAHVGAHDKVHSLGEVSASPAACVKTRADAVTSTNAYPNANAIAEAEADNGGEASDRLAMALTLTKLLDAGHELALHGYTHADSAGRPRTPLNYFVRRVYTRGEGEFAALAQAEALARIDLGLDWFAEHHWPVDGFVPPAWLASAGTRAALQRRPFSYTTTVGHFVFLPSERALWSPSLMYTARNRAGRWLSPQLADAMAHALADHPLIRLSLHPADARHPALLRHAQELVARLLKTRQPMTKAQFALCYRGPTRVLHASKARPPPAHAAHDSNR